MLLCFAMDQPLARLLLSGCHLVVDIYFISICRTSFDLRKLDIDQTHDITLNLEDEAGSLRLMVTITGAVSSTDHEVAATTRKEITRKYVSG